MYIFSDAVKDYTANPTKENLNAVTDKLLAEMTTTEKNKTLCGHAMPATIANLFKYARYYNATPYAAGGCKRLGIPEVLFTDGPRGVVMGKSTCFPVSMLRGATFDDELEYRVGQAIAAESIAQGANYYAGICINLLRHPKWGRAQETYGEDQYLLGKMGAALTRAVQDAGMMACPKHYALNSIEDLRFSVDAKADDRTLREIYLPHFKKCIDAGALSIMGAYNRVNGTYCCESAVLLKDILRGEMGFDGFTISDFMFGIYDCARSLKAGLDIEMPYTFRYGKLSSCLRKGTIDKADVDASVKCILGALIRSVPKIKPQGKEVIVSRPHTDLSREVATKGIVLLKNKGDVLPIKAGAKIAVVGRYADKKNVGDHGSSQVFSPYTVTPYQGLARVYKNLNVALYNGCDVAQAKLAVKNSDYVVVCVGSDHTQEGEFLINFGKLKKKPKGNGGDRVSLRIPPEDVALIRGMVETGKKVIVNIMGGSAYVINDWSGEVDGIMMSFYAGLEGGNAIADIISGKVNPSGRLPFTIAKSEEDYPPFLAIEDRKYEIDYGYYHGYALFDKQQIEPDYPFGFGLSYTGFETKFMGLAKDSDALSVSVKVTNTGKRDGATVVQVYVGSAGADDDRPVKQLKGFKRIEIKSGETVDVVIPISYEDMKFYRPEDKSWVLDEKYNVYVGEDAKAADAQCLTVSFVAEAEVA